MGTMMHSKPISCFHCPQESTYYFLSIDVKIWQSRQILPFAQIKERRYTIPMPLSSYFVQRHLILLIYPESDTWLIKCQAQDLWYRGVRTKSGTSITDFGYILYLKFSPLNNVDAYNKFLRIIQERSTGFNKMSVWDFRNGLFSPMELAGNERQECPLSNMHRL